MTDIIPVPEGVNSSEFPTNADRTAGTFNPKVVAWASTTRAQSVRDREIAVATRTNAIATDERAQIASTKAGEASGSAAAAAADALRLASLDALWLGALTADPATGRNGVPLVAGNAYVNTATGYIRAYNGSAWVQGVSAVAGVKSLNGQIGDLVLKTIAGQAVLGSGDISFSTFQIGDARATVAAPGVDWLEANKIYLQSSYTELYAKLGIISDGLVISAKTYPVDTRVVIGGNGVFISAGTGVASVRRSVDGGDTWATIAVPSTQTWAAGIYGGGVFVLFASDGSAATTVAIISSDGGLTWQQKTVPSALWSSVAYDATSDTFLAVSSTSTIGATSIDKGQSWQAITLPAALSGSVRPRVAGGGGVFLLIYGFQADRATCWTTSNKGAAWVTRTLPSSVLARSAAFLKGRFVILNTNTATSFASDDLGVTWAAVALPVSATWGFLAEGAGLLIGVSQNSGDYFISSSDGRAWRLNAAPSAGSWSNTASDGIDFLVARDTGTAGAKIKTVTYDRVTQFYIPEPFAVATPFKNWVKAK